MGRVHKFDWLLKTVQLNEKNSSIDIPKQQRLEYFVDVRQQDSERA
jgi:hypothetical protein